MEEVYQAMQFSILTTHYNQSDTIKKLHSSLLAQKEYVKEFVIYDDGSDEKHVSELKKLSGMPIRLILAHHIGKHLTHHFNKALAVATGKVVVQIFGDSYLADDALKKLSESYVEGSVGCGYEYLVNENGTIVSNDYRLEPTDEVIEITGQERAWYSVPGNSLIAPRDLLVKIGGADERYTGYGKDDTDLVMRLSMNGARIILYNNVKVYHPNEISEQDSPDNTKLLEDKIRGVGYQSGATTIALDFDDFSLENNQFLYLEQLKSMFPALKVSMFMIPWDYQLHPQMQDFQREQMIQKIKQNLDWIELIPHGLTHKPREFEAVNYKDYDVIFAAIDEVFTRYGLPYVKGFKAPYWLYNEGLVEYLNKKGWWLAVDRNQPNAPRTKKFYEYTHSIHEPFWLSKSPLIKLHGHISAPSANDLPSNMINLLKMNPKAEFKFVSELV